MSDTASQTSSQRQGKTLQLWKTNDNKAQKAGACQTVYWVKTKKEQKQEPLLRKLAQRELKQPTTSVTSPAKWETGMSYKGEWQGNQKHGFGEQTWSNGNKYEGHWAGGQRSGTGVLWVMGKDGKLRKVYSGYWSEDARDGLGVNYYEDGGRYEGNWRKDQRHGQGTMFFTNGDIYVGEWYQGKQGGQGRLQKANQDIYEGEWVNGKREGAGVYYYKAQEKVYDGEWVNDVPKCGVYIDAMEFFGDADDVKQQERRLKRPLPVLKLAKPDELLESRIDAIQKQRQATRQLTQTQITDMFDDNGLSHLTDVFHAADPNGTGKIPCTSLRPIFDELSLEVTDEELAEVLQDLDKSAKDATLDLNEFIKAAHLSNTIVNLAIAAQEAEDQKRLEEHEASMHQQQQQHQTQTVTAVTASSSQGMLPSPSAEQKSGGVGLNASSNSGGHGRGEAIKASLKAGLNAVPKFTDPVSSGVGGAGLEV